MYNHYTSPCIKHMSVPVSRVLYSLRSDDHLSGMPVTWHLKRPNPGAERAIPLPPYSVLLQVGFTEPASHLAAGELLPHLSTLACAYSSHRRYVSVALSLESPPLGITQHPALWSSDFPQAQPFGIGARDHPAYSCALFIFSRN